MNISTLVQICRFHDPSVRKVSVVLDIIEELNKLFYILFKGIEWSILVQMECDWEKVQIDLN